MYAHLRLIKALNCNFCRRRRTDAFHSRFDLKSARAHSFAFNKNESSAHTLVGLRKFTQRGIHSGDGWSSTEFQLTSGHYMENNGRKHILAYYQLSCAHRKPVTSTFLRFNGIECTKIRSKVCEAAKRAKVFCCWIECLELFCAFSAVEDIFLRSPSNWWGLMN